MQKTESLQDQKCKLEEENAKEVIKRQKVEEKLNKAIHTNGESRTRNPWITNPVL